MLLFLIVQFCFELLFSQLDGFSEFFLKFFIQGAVLFKTAEPRSKKPLSRRQSNTLVQFRYNSCYVLVTISIPYYVTHTKRYLFESMAVIA